MADPVATAAPPASQTPGLMQRTLALVTGKSNPQRTQQIDAFKQFKKESFADRYIFERQWTRVIHYLNGRQWLAQWSREKGWQDARLARGIPKPVTNKAVEIDTTIRAMFATVELGVDARPTSKAPKDAVTAGVADDLIPLLHDVHHMTDVMDTFDYWFANLGTGALYTSWDKTATSGLYRLPYEVCTACQQAFRSDAIHQAQQKCPNCGGNAFVPATDDDGSPKFDVQSEGGAITEALSPLELAWPLIYAHWRQLPGLLRLYWRDKRSFEEHPDLKKYVDHIKWTRDAGERSMQIFKSIPFQNDLGNAQAYTAQRGETEGVAVYEWWMRPTAEHPDGFVGRYVGENDPIELDVESEGLPGPLPYKNAAGNPLWTFSIGRYRTVGGRILGSGVHDNLFQKYDQLNRLDSLNEMIITRTASPQWAVPKGAEVQWLGDSPGTPGLVLQWNPQMAGSHGRPELMAGRGPDRSIPLLRQQILNDIDQQSGVYDVLKGAKPPGVEAFSAMQLLVERGESRFARPMAARANCYREWAGFALELERMYGPTERTYAVLSPAGEYAITTFKQADLAGSVTLRIEDGTNRPKTALGMRAMVDHLAAMKLLDPNNADQRHAIFRKFGALDLAPSEDIQVQGALRRQEAFEKWIVSGAWQPAAQQAGVDQSFNILQQPDYPLRWRRWYDPVLSRQEFLKWVNGDTMHDLRAKFKGAFDGLLEASLAEIDLAVMQKQSGMALDPGGIADLTTSPDPPPAGSPPPGRSGAGQTMTNSNQNSAATTSLPGGPAMQGGQAPA